MTIRSKRRLSVLGAITAIAALVLAGAAEAIAPVNRTFLGGLAIDGYDAVAYFTDAKPVEGSKQLYFEWQGATWRFATAEHRDLFAADPAKYAPQYGGYCAWAVAHGYTASTDPEAWRIHDGKLYLNYDKEIQAKWLADIPTYVRDGDGNWPKLLAEK